MSDVSVTFKNPLTGEHLADINAALEAIKEARRQIDLAKRAGIDVALQEAAANDAEDKLKRIKQVYFPNR